MTTKKSSKAKATTKTTSKTTTKKHEFDSDVDFNDVDSKAEILS
jgi:hypothetical protein